MKQEQKYIAAINQIERERIHVVEAMTSGEEERTLTVCLSQTEGTERAMLEKLRDDLTAVISELKNINQLNQQLTEQSLQFVNVMLDMLMPQPPEMNYGAPNKAAAPYEGRRSLFDSKA
jgi:flagellar biosynthesis/type III secretory pathway chaperone